MIWLVLIAAVIVAGLAGWTHHDPTPEELGVYDRSSPYDPGPEHPTDYEVLSERIGALERRVNETR